MLTHDPWFSTRRLTTALLLVGLLATVVGGAASATLGRFERAAVDERYRLRGAHEADPRVVVIGIDDATLVAEQLQPPYPRLLHADVLRHLREAGAATVAYDLAFTGATDADNDNALLDELDRATRPVVGVVGLAPNSNESAMLAGQVPLPSDHVAPGNTARENGRSGSWTEFKARVERLDAFPVVAAARYLGRAPQPAPRRALIDYPDDDHPFRTFSFTQVLEGQVPDAALRGKLVVVGNTAAQLQDNHQTPFGLRPGPELQAAGIATALHGFQLRHATPSASAAALAGAGAAVPLLLLLGGGLTRLVRRGRATELQRAPLTAGWVVISGAAVAVVWLAATQLAFNGGVVLNATGGLVGIVAATALAVTLARVAERRRFAIRRQQFAEGVDNDLIQRALSDDGADGPVSDLAGLIDGITLLERRSNGATGIVYRARQELIEREIAVKVIRSSLVASARARKLFHAEARALGRLWHPHVVPIFEVGDDRDVFYIAMRWLGGGDLSDLAMPVAPATAASLVRGIASALDAAHAAGITHGDVKPANVLLDPDDPEHGYLIDFGIALVDADGAPAVGKSPQYASPEVFAGDEISTRADTYALGVLSFLLLSGDLPFAGNAERLELQHRTADRPAASAFNAALPPAVDAVLQRAMAIAPADRPASAGAFAAALAAALAD